MPSAAPAVQIFFGVGFPGRRRRGHYERIRFADTSHVILELPPEGWHGICTTLCSLRIFGASQQRQHTLFIDASPKAAAWPGVVPRNFEGGPAATTSNRGWLEGKTKIRPVRRRVAVQMPSEVNNPEVSVLAFGQCERWSAKFVIQPREGCVGVWAGVEGLGK